MTTNLNKKHILITAPMLAAHFAFAVACSPSPECKLDRTDCVSSSECLLVASTSHANACADGACQSCIAAPLCLGLSEDECNATVGCAGTYYALAIHCPENSSDCPPATFEECVQVDDCQLLGEEECLATPGCLATWTSTQSEEPQFNYCLEDPLPTCNSNDDCETDEICDQHRCSKESNR